MTHFLVYWRKPGWGRSFPADIMADSPLGARRLHAKLFPEDQILGVKAAKGWDNKTKEGGRWLA